MIHQHLADHRGYRDQAAAERDQDAAERDRVGDERDQAGDDRDQTAEQRDQTATATDALNRSALARREAASDRRRASQDRRSGARERTEAEADRNTALTDRGASAREREDASVDELTGMYLRRAGLVELEREMARASRTQQPLVLAFIEVDRLMDIHDSRGLAAADRTLIEVARALRAALRSYDLIIRYGDDRFIYAITGVDMAGAAKRLALVNAVLAELPGHGSITLGLAEFQSDDSPQGLVARADASLRRQRQQRSDNALMQVRRCGDLIVDEGTHSVTRAGFPIRLTATEFKLLVVLGRNGADRSPAAR